MSQLTCSKLLVVYRNRYISVKYCFSFHNNGVSMKSESEARNKITLTRIILVTAIVVLLTLSSQLANAGWTKKEKIGEVRMYIIVDVLNAPWGGNAKLVKKYTYSWKYGNI